VYCEIEYGPVGNLVQGAEFGHRGKNFGTGKGENSIAHPMDPGRGLHLLNRSSREGPAPEMEIQTRVSKALGGETRKQENTPDRAVLPKLLESKRVPVHEI